MRDVDGVANLGARQVNRDEFRNVAGKGVQLTALNFSAEPVSETICLPGVAPGPVVDIIHESVEGDLTDNCELQINLDPYEGLALRVVSAAPPVI